MPQMAQPVKRPDTVYCLVTQVFHGTPLRHYFWTRKGLDKAVDVWYNGRTEGIEYHIERGEILWSREIPLKEE